MMHDADRDEVLAVDRSWLSLLNFQNPDQLSRTLTENFVYITHHGSEVSKSEFLKDHAEKKVRISSIENRDANVRFFGPTFAIVTGVDLLRANLFDVHFNGPYCFSRVWIKQDRWLLANFHISDARLIEKWRSVTKRLIR